MYWKLEVGYVVMCGRAVMGIHFAVSFSVCLHNDMIILDVISNHGWR